VVLEDIELGEGVKDLGDLGPGETAALKVTLLVREGQDFPRADVTATSLGKPVYSRHATARGKETILLPGLGPGKFRVEVRAGDIFGAPIVREVTSTGEGEIPLLVDLR
jgi:hypothetical protein